jgi:uncharacterized membrane protein
MQLSIIWQILAVSLLFVFIDSTYLYSSKNYFQQQITSIQGTPIQLRIGSTILCYIALIFGLWVFILREKRPWTQAFLLGLVIYAVYETTNYATFTKWKWQTVVMDSLWGATLFALTTKLVYTLKIV